MGKSMMIGVLGIVAVACGLSRQLAAQGNSGTRKSFPKACYFFVPQKEDKTEKRAQARDLDDERAYDASFAEVYRLWCTPVHSSPSTRMAAVDKMVKKWKTVWERDDPFNAEFHETSAVDLLYLLGLTHQLPAQMVSDPQLTREWVEACADSCFTIWEVPENRKQEHTLAMELWLRNDVLDNLKQESASEPVIKMLQEAHYRLID
jgi:hypothetical protein